MVFLLCLPRADCWENLVWLMVPGEEKLMSPGGGAVPLAGPSLCHHPLSSLSSEDSPDKGFRYSFMSALPLEKQTTHSDKAGLKI